MLDTPRKTALTLGAAVAMVGLAAAIAIAAGDTDDSLSPANTAVTITNSGNITATGTVNEIGVTVTCTKVTIDLTTPSSGLTEPATSTPVFSGCTDSFGGTDTVTWSGTSSVTLVDNSSETQAEPNSGDQITINIPQGGATITSTALPGCSITTNASNPESSSFDDMNTATFKNAPISVTGSGCSTASSISLSGQFVGNINVGDLTT